MARVRVADPEPDDGQLPAALVAAVAVLEPTRDLDVAYRARRSVFHTYADEVGLVRGSEQWLKLRRRFGPFCRPTLGGVNERTASE